jgi:hypothetical protein
MYRMYVFCLYGETAMPKDPVTASDADWPLTNPYPALAVGLVMASIAWLWHLLLGNVGTPLRVLLIIAAVVSAGTGVHIRFRDLGRALEERLRSAGVLALAALVAFLADLALNDEWDMAGLPLHVLIAVALAGAICIQFPPQARRAVVSLLALVHFGGILTAVTMLPPPAGQGTWWANQLWVRFYRPYLQFFYLNNAYHFYSPEPGPAELLWFRVEYADGSGQWVKVPDRNEYQPNLISRRWGSLPVSASQFMPSPPVFPPELVERRREAGTKHQPPIPLPEGELNQQYRQPTPESQLLLGSYACYVARTHPHPRDSNQVVTGVKIYQVEYSYPTQEDIAEGIDFYEPTLYRAYYQGEYDTNGRLKPSSFQMEFQQEGDMVRTNTTQDPFLHWWIPIIREGDPKQRTMPVQDYVKIHAGEKE